MLLNRPLGLTKQQKLTRGLTTVPDKALLGLILKTRETAQRKVSSGWLFKEGQGQF